MILVTGGSGQVSSEIYKLSKNKNYKFIFKSKKNLDISNFERVKKYINENKIKILINTAAITKVDYCEKYKSKCILVNYHSVKNIVKVCKKNNILLIHISTDYVYDGKSKKEYKETAKTIPLNVYGLSKLKADEYIKKHLKKFIIIRSGWIFSKSSNSFIQFIDNLIKNKKEINLIDNQFGNPTSAKSLAETILKFVDINNSNKKLKYGVYNFCNFPSTNWYSFGKFYIHNIINNKKIKINKIKSELLGLSAKRPKSTKLNCNKLQTFLKVKKIKWRKELFRI